MDCESCKERQRQAAVPYYVHEGDMARMERTVKRLWILLILVMVLLVGSNAAWVWYESQFEEVVTTVEQELETGDGDMIVSGIGDIRLFGFGGKRNG